MTALPVRLQRQAVASGWRTLCFRSDMGLSEQFDLEDPQQSTSWELVAVRPKTRLEITFKLHKNKNWTLTWAAIRRRPEFCKSQEWEEFLMTDCIAPLARLDDYFAVLAAIWAQDEALQYIRLPNDPAQCLGARECHRILARPQQ